MEHQDYMDDKPTPDEEDSKSRKMRLKVHLHHDDTTLDPLRLPINSKLTINDLRSEITRRAAVGGDAVLAPLKAEDGSVLHGEDVIEDVLDTGDAVYATFSTPSTTTTTTPTTATSTTAGSTISVCVKRVGATALLSTIPKEGTTRVRDFKTQLCQLDPSMAATRLIISGRFLDDDDCLQEIYNSQCQASSGSSATNNQLVLFSARMDATMPSSSLPPSGASVKTITIHYRRVDSATISSLLHVPLNETLAGLKGRIAAQDGISRGISPTTTTASTSATPSPTKPGLPRQGSYQVFVRCSGRTITIDDVLPGDTIASLKLKIYHKVQIDPCYKPEYQSLQYGSRPLRDNNVVAQYGITKECTLEVLTRFSGINAFHNTTPRTDNGTTVSWEPQVIAIDLARPTHFLYTTEETEGKTLKDWGFEEDPFVFVIVRGAKVSGPVGDSLMGRRAGGWLAEFGAEEAWAPYQHPKQTSEGMACFLSTLYVVVEMLKKNKAARTQFLNVVGHFSACPPVVLALHMLCRQSSIGPLEKATIASCLYAIIRQLLPTNLDNAKVFEGTRAGMYFLLSYEHSPFSSTPPPKSWRLDSVSLECPISNQRLEKPVVFGGRQDGRAFSRDALTNLLSIPALPGNQITDTYVTTLGIPADVNPKSLPIIPDKRREDLLLAYPYLTDVVVVGPVEEEAGGGKVSSGAPLGPITLVGTYDWNTLVRLTKSIPQLRILRPLSLKRAPIPSLTIDQDAHIATYLGRTGKGADVNKNTQLFRPVHDATPVSVDVNEVAQAVERALERGTIDATTAGFMDDREPEEGVVLLLDISQSMTSTGFVEGEENAGSDDEEEDEEEGEDDMNWESEGEEGENSTHMPAFPSDDMEGVPKDLQCPISHCLMLDPVVASDGHTYSRGVIEEWMEDHDTSPMTREELNPEVDLRTNTEMEKRVLAWLRVVYPALLAAKGQSFTPPTAAATGASGSSSGRGRGRDRGKGKGRAVTMIKLHMESDFTKPHSVEVDPSTTTIAQLRDIIMVEWSLALPSDWVVLSKTRGSAAPLDVTQSLAAAEFSDGDKVRVTVRQGARAGEEERQAKVYVVHVIDSKNKRENSLMVRGDVTALRMKRMLADTGNLGLSGALNTIGLWYDLKPIGDGHRRGQVCDDGETLGTFINRNKGGRSRVIELELAYISKAKKQKGRLSRVVVVKALFDSWINRLEGYDFANHCGLVLFGSDVKEECRLTPLYEDFRLEVAKVEARGDTRMLDAIEHGASMLTDFRQKYPKARLRMICLTDGVDTCSNASAESVAKLLQEERILLDALLINSSDKTLLSIAKASGGYAFKPSSMREGLKLMELETLLSSLHRPDPWAHPPRRPVTTRASLVTFAHEKYDVCNDLVVPPGRQHPQLQAPVVPLKTALEHLQKHEGEGREGDAHMATNTTTVTGHADTSTKETSSSSSSEAPHPQRLSTIVREMRRLLGPGRHEFFDIFPSRDDPGFWRVLMEGPLDTIYAGGCWLLYVEFPPQYPLVPPSVRFVTPIRHANVNNYGRICHSLLSRNWTSETSMSVVLACIYGLLLQPDVQDPLDADLAQAFFAADGQYEAAIMKHMDLYAKKKTREQWREELSKEEEQS